MNVHGSTVRNALFLGLAALFAAAGCATSSTGDSSGEETAAESGNETNATPEVVVVPSSAEFASGSEDGADTWSHEAGDQWRFRVVSEAGDWLELEAAEAGSAIAPMLTQIDLTVFVRRDAVEPAPEETGASPDPETPAEAYQLSWVAPDSPLYWSDGSSAGAVRAEKWPLRLELETREGRHCFAANLRESAPKEYDPDRHFRICVAEDDRSVNEDAPRAASESADDGQMVGMLETAFAIRFTGVSGGLTWDDIKAPVVEHKDALKSCYDDAVTPDNQFDGELAVTLRAAPSGEVQTVDTSRSTLPDATVPNCVSDALGAISFPSVSEATDIDLEFVFSAETR